MALIDELKSRKIELLEQTEAIDREAAKVREQYEEKLAELRQQRIPLEERIRTIDALIKSEGGQMMGFIGTIGSNGLPLYQMRMRQHLRTFPGCHSLPLPVPRRSVGKGERARPLL